MSLFVPPSSSSVPWTRRVTSLGLTSLFIKTGHFKKNPLELFIRSLEDVHSLSFINSYPRIVSFLKDLLKSFTAKDVHHSVFII